MLYTTVSLRPVRVVASSNLAAPTNFPFVASCSRWSPAWAVHSLV